MRLNKWGSLVDILTKLVEWGGGVKNLDGFDHKGAGSKTLELEYGDLVGDLKIASDIEGGGELFEWPIFFLCDLLSIHSQLALFLAPKMLMGEIHHNKHLRNYSIRAPIILFSFWNGNFD